jgi:hypothetical protein
VDRRAGRHQKFDATLEPRSPVDPLMFNRIDFLKRFFNKFVHFLKEKIMVGKVGGAIYGASGDAKDDAKAGIKVNTDLNAIEGGGKVTGKGEKIGTGAIQG